MGSKSSKAPAPDPRLVEAQIRSMGVQDDAIAQVLAIAREQQAANEELMPLQRQAMEFGLDAQRTGYAQSQADREWLLNRRGALSGLQDRLVAEATDFNSEARAQQMVDKAQADVGQSIAKVREARGRELASMGVAPGSGRFAAADNLSEAMALAGAANNARFQVRQEGRALTDRAVNTLAGYPAMATGATGQASAAGGNAVTVTNAGAGGINAGYGAMTGAQQAAAGIAGQMGSNATSMFGTQANYQLAADRQANDSSWLGGVGSILGGAAQAYKVFSAREYKQDVTRVGTHPRLGIGIYRWRYTPAMRARAGSGWHVGVMADEVSAVLPGAVSTDADGFTVVDMAQI